MCIMCGSFYHTNEIVSKYNSGCPVKFIDNALIICQDHPNVALTSNLPYDELSSGAKQIIAQIKQEIISEIILEKHNNNQKGHNDTVYEDYSEFESLKIENQLLKQLNNELQDKNRIFSELLTKEKQGNYNNIKKSFCKKLEPLTLYNFFDNTKLFSLKRLTHQSTKRRSKKLT